MSFKNIFSTVSVLVVVADLEAPSLNQSVWPDGYVTIQPLAIYNNEKLPSSIKMPKMAQNFAKYLITQPKICTKTFTILHKVAKFRKIWSHWQPTILWTSFFLQVLLILSRSSFSSLQDHLPNWYASKIPVWPDWAIFKSCDDFSHKTGAIIWPLLWLFWNSLLFKCKILFGHLLDKFGQLFIFAFGHTANNELEQKIFLSSSLKQSCWTLSY